MPIDLDLNNPEFQKNLFTLEKADLQKVAQTLRKLLQMDWQQIYSDKGLNWKYIRTKEIYTLRASRKIRIAALREGNIMRLLSIHVDHDSAYD